MVVIPFIPAIPPPTPPLPLTVLALPSPNRTGHPRRCRLVPQKETLHQQTFLEHLRSDPSPRACCVHPELLACLLRAQLKCTQGSGGGGRKRGKLAPLTRSSLRSKHKDPPTQPSGSAYLSKCAKCTWWSGGRRVGGGVRRYLMFGFDVAPTQLGRRCVCGRLEAWQKSRPLLLERARNLAHRRRSAQCLWVR